ncbi:hypothetical protein [Streptomyces sp. NPDC086010]|uniref:hypothetical protein n=1 Tax=Streptomyces sp. NPDC086010 TaxID=3365745 RepID=UPI0037CD1594
MSQLSPPVPSGEVAASRIRRAVALPGAGESAGTTVTAEPSAASSPGTPSPSALAPQAGTDAEPAASVAEAERSSRNRLGSRLAALTPRRSGGADEPAVTAPRGPEAGLSAAVVGRAGSAAPGRERAAAAERQPGRVPHKPVFVAAAVAGAVLAAVPFLPQRGGTAVYEGKDGVGPVASFAAEDDEAVFPNGRSSSLPLDDAEGRYGVPTPEVRAPGENRADVPKVRTGTTGTERKPGSAEGEGREGSRKTSEADRPSHEADRRSHRTPVLVGASAGDGRQEREGARTKPSAEHRAVSAHTAGKSSGSVSPDGKTVAGTSTASVLRADSTGRTDPSQQAKQPATLKEPVQQPAARTVAARPPVMDQPVTGQPVERLVRATHVLRPGQPLNSGGAALSMEADGNLVVRDGTGVVRWAANTAGLGDRAVFQADGNLVVVDAAGEAVWTTGTAGNPGASLVVRTSGGVQIRTASGAVLWSAGATG